MSLVELSLSKDAYEIDVLDSYPGQEYFYQNGMAIDTKTNKILGLRKEKRERRTAEIELLKFLAQVAARNAKDIKESNLCCDLFATLDSTSAKDKLIVMDKRDVDCLVKAYEGLAGQRLIEWVLYCRNILKQLENPKAKDLK